MKNFSTIADNITATGWIPTPYKVGGTLGQTAMALQAIYAMSSGAGAAFVADIWVSPFSSLDGLTPKGLVKLEPQLTGISSVEFPTEAAQVYLFDAPAIWIHINVKSLVGSLSIVGVFE